MMECDKEIVYFYIMAHRKIVNIVYRGSRKILQEPCLISASQSYTTQAADLSTCYASFTGFQFKPRSRIKSRYFALNATNLECRLTYHRCSSSVDQRGVFARRLQTYCRFHVQELKLHLAAFRQQHLVFGTAFRLQSGLLLASVHSNRCSKHTCTILASIDHNRYPHFCSFGNSSALQILTLTLTLKEQR